MTNNDFKQAMRRLLAGVSLITTQESGTTHGFIATAVVSVSAEPPRILVCVNRSVSSHDVLRRSRVLCVNLLARDQEHVSRRFSSSEEREQRFSAGNWTVMATGAPVLADALASLDCTVAEFIPANSHTIFICDVKEIRYAEADREPLAYFDGRYVSMVAA